MPFAHPDSLLARKLSHSGSAASRASHMSTTPSSGRSDCVTSEVTTGERKTIVQTATHIRPKSASAPAGESNETAHSAARTRPKSNSVFPKTIEQNLPKATPSQIRLTREHTPPMGGVSPAPRVRRGTNGHLQDEVVVKRSTHATTGPREERHATLVKGQTISIEGQRADSHPQAANLAQLKQPPMKQALPRGRHTTSEDPDVAPPTMSGRTEHYKAEMESLCRPPNQRMVRPKAKTHRGDQTKNRDERPDNHHFATQLDHPNIFWKCPFCPVEQDTFLALKEHNIEHHGGQLFRFECDLCDFQADSPQLLRRHQDGVHEVNVTGVNVANDGNADTPIGVANVQTSNGTEELLCQESLEGGLAKQEDKAVDLTPDCSNGMLGDDRIEATTTIQVTRCSSSPNPEGQSRGDFPQVDSNHKSIEHPPGNMDPEATFLGNPLAMWPEDELQEVEETEVTPIKLEDDDSNVICPTCYDFIPTTQYSSHRRSKGCHPPARPLEGMGTSNFEPHRRTSRGKNYYIRSESMGKCAPTHKIGWSYAARPLVIRRVRQSEMQYWSAARDKMTAIYRAALRKPNVDGTYNVNGQVTSLQELKDKFGTYRIIF